MIALLPAALAAVIAGILAVAGYAGGWVVTAAAGLSVLTLAMGWGDELKLPSPRGTAVMVGGLGLASLVAARLAVSATSGSARPLAFFAAGIALGVLGAFVHELLRRDGRPNVLESITGTVTGQVLAVLASGWVLLSYTSAGSAGIVVAATAVAVSGLVAALPLPLPGPVMVWAGIALGVGGAVGASILLPDSSGHPGVRPITAVLVGVAVSVVGVAVDRIFGKLEAPRWNLSLLARAAAPVAAAGTVAYAVLRLTAG